jgi:D-alanine-D-alanine ligase
MLLPHRITINLLLSYLESKKADEIEEKIRDLIGGSKFKVGFEIISDRPPMSHHRTNLSLAKSLENIAEEWEVPMPHESSIWPSVAGLVPARIPVVCGIGPAARDLYTPQESINRTSLVQRTLVIAQFLAKDIKG